MLLNQVTLSFCIFDQGQSVRYRSHGLAQLRDHEACPPASGKAGLLWSGYLLLRLQRRSADEKLNETVNGLSV